MAKRKKKEPKRKRKTEAKPKPKKVDDRTRRHPEGVRRFSWLTDTIWYRVGEDDSSNGMPMPREFTLAAGCKVIRRDTGEEVPNPLSYSEAPCGSLWWEDEFFGVRQTETVRCDVVPGKVFA